MKYKIIFLFFLNKKKKKDHKKLYIFKTKFILKHLIKFNQNMHFEN